MHREDHEKHDARHATQTAVAASDFSPAMVALASCMAFSIILTGGNGTFPICWRQRATEQFRWSCANSPPALAYLRRIFCVRAGSR
jgi:hypothetical protein